MRMQSASIPGLPRMLAVDMHGGVGGEHRQILVQLPRRPAAFSRARRMT